jgi:nitrogen fixation/metabolism regulation signal transduction histidine kinase
MTILAYFFLAYNKALFFIVQVIVIFSAIISYRLYRNFVQPLEILSAGVESIRARDFGCTLIKTGHDELDSLIDVYNRMIEQLRAERLSLQRLNYFLDHLIKVAPIGIIIFDMDRKISMANPAAEKILNLTSSAMSHSLSEFARGPFEELENIPSGTTRVIKVDGVTTYRCHKSQFLDHGFHRQFILLDELTEEIIESQKKAYEKVIRAMSHEVNNSVGAINSILNSILDYGQQLTPDDGNDYREAVNVAIERNSGLSKFMANYAEVVKIPPPHKTEHDLHKSIKSIYALMHNDCIARNIKWRFELPAESMKINMDLNQMEQVLVNIIKNSMEAIDHDGTIFVKTALTPPTLYIIDTGRGIDSQIMSHLFTPFYTTKRDGQGIGLTLVREILINHGFKFSLRMNENNMTEFRITFDKSLISSRL